MNSGLLSFVAWAAASFGPAVAQQAASPPADLQTVADQTRSLSGPRRYDGPPLTLAAALAEATARNPELTAQRRAVDVTRERPAQAKALDPPMLETQIWQWPVNTFNPANTNMYMFMGSQDIPGRGKRDLRAQVAAKDVDLAESDVAIRLREVTTRVKQTYAALFLSRKAIDIYLTTADLLRQFADVTQTKYATGSISQQDVLKSVVELSRLHEDVIDYEQQQRIATAQLNTLMNRPVDAPIGPLTDPEERVLTISPAQLVESAIARRPELLAARQELERAEAELAVARQDRQPDFSIQGGYMFMPRGTDAWMGRLGITWPNAPWARGKVDAHVKEMAASVEAAKTRVQALENATRLAVREAYLTAKAAEQRASLLRTTILPQSRQTLDVSRIGYQTDRSDFLAMLDNERMVLEAQLQYYRAMSNFNQAIAELERSTGVDFTPDMFTVVGGAR